MGHSLQAVILAAGKSTRCYPLTLTRPKPLLPLLGTTILGHTLGVLRGLVDEVLIVVGYQAEAIKQMFGSEFEGLPIRYVEQGEQKGTAHALQVAGETQHRIHYVVPRVLDIVGLGYKADRYPGQLSGGEQQRVVIARSLVHRPKIVVADEPTGNLDAINTYEVIEILKKINEFGTTVVLVTHNREVVNSLKKRVITLHNGKIIADEQNGKYRL